MPSRLEKPATSDKLDDSDKPVESLKFDDSADPPGFVKSDDAARLGDFDGPKAAATAEEDAGERAEVDSEPAPNDSRLPPAPVDAADSGSHRVVGRCEMFAEIAHGGMATVHIGRWIGAGGFNKIVAIKALYRQYARDPDFVTMFLDEARVVARIQHPNVMPTIDLIKDGGELFIVMDFVEGATLAQLLRQAKRRKERMPIGMVARVISGALHGLRAAHEAKNESGELMSVIHRDVSPENVLVGADGHARLIDFGISRALGRYTSTHDGQIKGKPPYLAPEQVKGEELTRKTDIFSASVVMWQALTGKKLFKARSVVEMTHKVLNQDVLPPSAIVPEVTVDYDAIVMRGLERKPDDRWDTAADMAEEIEKLGGMATNREVASWVRTMAATRLARTAEIVEMVENAPQQVPADALKRPLSVRPAPNKAVRKAVGRQVEAWSISEEDESKTDITALDKPVQGEPGEQPKLPRPLLLGAIGVAAVIALGVIGFSVIGDGDSSGETQGGGAASASAGAPGSAAHSSTIVQTAFTTTSSPIDSDAGAAAGPDAQADEPDAASLDAGEVDADGAGAASASADGAAPPPSAKSTGRPWTGTPTARPTTTKTEYTPPGI